MYIPHQPCLKAVLVFPGETFCTFKRKRLQRGFPTFFTAVALRSSASYYDIAYFTRRTEHWAWHTIWKSIQRWKTPALITIRRYVHCSWQTFCSSLWRCSCCFTACLMLCMKSILPVFSWDWNTQCSHRTDFFLQKCQLKSKNAKKSIKNAFKAKCRSCFEANHL